MMEVTSYNRTESICICLNIYCGGTGPFQPTCPVPLCPTKPGEAFLFLLCNHCHHLIFVRNCPLRRSGLGMSMNHDNSCCWLSMVCCHEPQTKPNFLAFQTSSWFVRFRTSPQKPWGGGREHAGRGEVSLLYRSTAAFLHTTEQTHTQLSPESSKGI